MNVPLDRLSSAFYLAVLFGCIYFFVLLALEPYLSLLASPMVEAVRTVGVTESATFKIINRVFWTVIWAVVSGLIFGLPLGLLARSHWARAWVAFLITSIGIRLVSALAGEYGLSEFLSAWNLPGEWGLAGFLWEWSLPEVWTSMLGVALFAWLGSRMRTYLRRQNRVAP